MIDLEKIYDYRFKDINSESKTAVWNEISRYLYHLLGEPKKILDPCAGNGEFLNSLEKAECWGVDIQSTILRTKKPHVKAVISDIFDADLPKNYFNSIFISNFLEHLNSHEQLIKFIRKMYECLEIGGKICILGPNFKYAYKEYFDCIDHKLILTHYSLSEILHAENFHIRECIKKFLPFSFRSKLPASSLLTKLYLQMPFLWSLFGKQFLIIAEK